MGQNFKIVNQEAEDDEKFEKFYRVIWEKCIGAKKNEGVL